METTETIQKPKKKAKKTRSPFDKEGSFKYLQRWMRRIEDKIDNLGRRQRRIETGLDLGGYLLHNQVFIHDTVCKSEIDVLILEELYSAGEDGELPRDIAVVLNKRLHSRHWQPWHVRYALKRMNRKLEQEANEHIAEKHGLRWALTPFTRKAWRLTKKEALEAQQH